MSYYILVHNNNNKNNNNNNNNTHNINIKTVNIQIESMNFKGRVPYINSKHIIVISICDVSLSRYIIMASYVVIGKS